MSDDNVNYARCAKFAEHNILCNQTYLVNTLLKNDKWQDLQDCLYNMYTYTLKVHTDTIKVPENQFFEMSDGISEKLRLLCIDKEALLRADDRDRLNTIQKDIAKLDEELDRFENAPCQEKEILEWWLIPFWLSEKLIAKGETVLRAYDCNWWGRTDHKRAVPLDAVIRNIKQELDKDI